MVGPQSSKRKRAIKAARRKHTLILNGRSILGLGRKGIYQGRIGTLTRENGKKGQDVYSYKKYMKKKSRRRDATVKQTTRTRGRILSEPPPEVEKYLRGEQRTDLGKLYSSQRNQLP